MPTAKPWYQSATTYALAVSIVTKLLVMAGLAETDAGEKASVFITGFLPVAGILFDLIAGWGRKRAQGPLTLTKTAAESHNADSNMQAGFARPALLVMVSTVAVVVLGLLQGCTTTPDGRRELTETGKVALQEVASIVVERHFRESPKDAEYAQKIRTLLAELAELPDVTTVAALRQVVQLRIDERVSDPDDQKDYTRLLNILSAVLSDYVGSGQLDALAVVKVRDFLGYVAAAIPVLPPA